MKQISVSDSVLAAHPLHTLFFSIFALFFYAALVFGIAGWLSPQVAEAARGEGENAISITWMMQVVLQMVMLGHITFWAERAGAGPFAGPVRSEISWAGFGIVAAPVIYYLAISFSFYVVSGGDPDWAFRDEVSREAVSRAALGPMLVLSVVLLAPVLEEVTYRGVVMGFLLGRGIPPLISILVAATGFTALHLQYTPAALISVFALGVFLGWLRVASRSIGPPILAHMAVNLYGVVGLWASPP